MNPAGIETHGASAGVGKFVLHFMVLSTQLLASSSLIFPRYRWVVERLACRIHPLIVVVVFIRLAHCDLMALTSQRPDIGLGYHVGMAAAEQDQSLTHDPFPYYLCIREYKNLFS